HCFTRTIAAALAGAILISAGAAGAQSAPPPAGAQTARISYLPGELASPPRAGRRGRWDEQAPLPPSALPDRARREHARADQRRPADRALAGRAGPHPAGPERPLR